MQIHIKKHLACETTFTNSSHFITQRILEEKSKVVEQEIQKIDSICRQWLGTQLSSKHMVLNERESTKKELFDMSENDENEMKKWQERAEIVNRYMDRISELFLQENSFKFMTYKQIREFFNENITQLKNKIKLYEEIQKLKLYEAYPNQDAPKRNYSKQSVIVLKKWLIEHYNNPYPSKREVKIMVEKTKLTQKQVLNWFINSRNAMKSKLEKPDKFGDQVYRKIQDLQTQKKIKMSSIESF